MLEKCAVELNIKKTPRRWDKPILSLVLYVYKLMDKDYMFWRLCHLTMSIFVLFFSKDLIDFLATYIFLKEIICKFNSRIFDYIEAHTMIFFFVLFSNMFRWHCWDDISMSRLKRLLNPIIINIDCKMNNLLAQ